MGKTLRTGAVALGLSIVAGLAAADTLTIATVSNPDMERIQRLSDEFTAANPNIELEWAVLDENTLRQRVTTDIATGAGRFDIVTIGGYEAPIWAERGWLSSLEDLPSTYDVDDLLPTVRDSLSYNETLYAAPFYGESSFTMYRADLFEAVGIEMAEDPSWDFIRSSAAEISKQNPDVYGTCLRGKPGWGENIALITAMANSYGARWFDADWRPELDSDAWAGAVGDYISLLSEYGPTEPETKGLAELLELFQQGKCAIWVDATVAASSVSDPAVSSVAGNVGFAQAPDNGLGKRSNWLWSWALGISAASEHQDAAKAFVAWATSVDYAALVSDREGWQNVPPGTRASLYNTPEYVQAAPFAGLVLASIEGADPANPTVEDVPYTGLQYVAIPEFPGIGNAVGTQIAKALTGEISTEKALTNGQWVAEKVIERARFLNSQ